VDIDVRVDIVVEPVARGDGGALLGYPIFVETMKAPSAVVRVWSFQISFSDVMVRNGPCLFGASFSWSSGG
jgi:hypothetical protein